jgi:hypothetical protein
MAIALLVFVGQACAIGTTTVLTFEGLQDQESINDFYNGGTGSLGSSGPNDGVSFTSDSLALKSTNPLSNFSNNPSGDTIAFFLNGFGDTMNVAGGFDTGFSFFYAAAFAGSVNVYDGLNGTGSLLASLALPVTQNPYTEWAAIGVTFNGIAKSAVFGGSANYIGFDDITLGSSTPGQSVPDGGSTMLLMGMAFTAIGFARNKFNI